MSTVLPAGSRAAELAKQLARRPDISQDDVKSTETELDALLDAQHKQDELVREQLELLARLRTTGPAKFNGRLGEVMDPLLEGMAQNAQGILAVGRTHDILGYLEARKRHRKEIASTPLGGDGNDQEEDQTA